jgi:hypothetical protein
MIGKSIRSVERNEPGFGISVLFTDGTGLAIHTEVYLRMSDTAARIERVTSTKQEIILHLGEHDFLAISTDRQKYDAVELFVFQDADGTFVVEN